ncbi:BON domain-containing protein [Pseudidiomarina sp. CB1]|uniref:BON domain-containing protein n=1 Tax=Pseudidiomarina sp. CB1 TaxID=2972484 RepID=UPI0021632A66|nr:BON domain-containing protein [Pseudidiomarina sp. CB1]
MKNMNRLALLALFSSLTLAACSQAEQESAENQTEQAMEQTEAAANEAAQETEEAAEKAADAAGDAWDETKDAAGDAWDETKEAAGEAGDFLSDAAITGRVKAALVEADQIEAMNINVETIDGHVVLSGIVASADIADLAAQIAEGIEGVQSVENDIEVQN